MIPGGSDWPSRDPSREESPPQPSHILRTWENRHRGLLLQDALGATENHQYVKLTLVSISRIYHQRYIATRCGGSLLFGGFEHDPASGTKLALPEKALFDFLYLSPTRGRLFAALPELELPRGFRRSVARAWADRVPSRRSRTIVQSKLDEVLRHR